MSSAIVFVVLIICITINSMHKRNKKVEVAIEALKQGHRVDVDL